ncbi:FAD-binding and (Fe-S)-binding domain-containing protein [Mycolicibacterium poriferae]|uniref:Lactate dehydrogenase n=1 Tax=Mycolicibacterium poriferae TaxID=39694 RepID=A0A6N4V191_9MYCO|nr:FAD-binding and (Fe-S)-binding domain-containing protein [Mycolicibacterium poriferae]MAS04144.1 FAD-binding oxidoreductase [Ahrensia sp.]MCV7262497.1 FAD-binding oxidoreductase [Mycolicibacterium poriferae]BBX49216.1 lactate dehydrogenase [Mycolicibacterium poriferae]
MNVVGPDTTFLSRLAASTVEVDTSSRRLAEYSYDASNYRLTPLAVAFPRTPGEVSEIAALCHDSGVAVVARGGGTSMAGNAIGRGVVLDMSRYMNRVLSIDSATRTAVVEPGVVLADLTAAVQRCTADQLTFAPDPSSKNRATVGGSIGNDACGNHSVRYGRTGDHVVALDLVLADGTRLTATRTGLRATDPADITAAERATALSAELRALTDGCLAAFRLELGRIPRQVSGFHLANLLPENGFDVARALVGSEGTCAIVVGAIVALVDVPRSTLLLIVAYDDIVDAARDVVTILKYSPAAVEGIDEQIVSTMKARRGQDAVADLPAGHAWLYIDLDGEDDATVARHARELMGDLDSHGRARECREVRDPVERAKLWRVREDGAGLSSRLQLADGTAVMSWPGWEDSAVAPENLADYLAELRLLLMQYQLIGVMYGHFGAGCMHIRITFDQRTPAGRQLMSAFLTDAARLVVKHGGTLSGEHGDGRARSQLLPEMYSPAIMEAFARFKHLFDPANILNPGMIVDPEPVTDNLALAAIPPLPWQTTFTLHEATGSGASAFTEAVQRCIGVGRCRSHSSGVMCPSYRATGDEKDSTRGRARVLQEMVRGARTVQEGWASQDVQEVLDLCLSCKACSSDCPTGVDMATYKAEFLDHYYRGRVRPVAHYSLGWLPRWLTLTAGAAPLVNAALASPLRSAALRLGGLTTHRVLPTFASRGQLRRELGTPHTGTSDLVLLVDSFTKGFRPEVAGAARRVVEDSGHRAEVRTDFCCGLTWISTGQLRQARKRLTRTAATLDDGTDRPIVVIEPSCAAALRKDLPELVNSTSAQRVARRVRTFAEQVSAQSSRGWTPKIALPESVTVQTHCHEYAVFGAATQRDALAAIGIGRVREATGCCGVAGNFGFERQHYDVSMAVAEQALAPALRADPGAVVLTDGFSCHMQARQLTDTPTSSASLHLAQILDPRSEIQQ